MARHSFIQMSKLSDVKGRISYISDPKLQEYLYATFSTREDMTFWNDLAEWERQVNGEKQPQQKPPEKESFRKKLRDMEAEAKRRNDARRQEPRHRSHDYDRGR